MNWGIVNGWVIETFRSDRVYWLGKATKNGQEIHIVRRSEDAARDSIIAIVRAGS